jgi:hypothetical protein
VGAQKLGQSRGRNPKAVPIGEEGLGQLDSASMERGQELPKLRCRGKTSEAEPRAVTRR